MTVPRRNDPGVAELETPAAPVDATTARGLRECARSLCSACRQVFGIPDYERYLAHSAQRHPGAPVLSREDFWVQAMERRYAKGGARCC